ncbi:MAG: hypothetical protein ACRCTW_09435, partial [Lactococcus garvieae]
MRKKKYILWTFKAVFIAYSLCYNGDFLSHLITEADTTFIFFYFKVISNKKHRCCFFVIMEDTEKIEICG